jgi:hypothetical protein
VLARQHGTSADTESVSRQHHSSSAELETITQTNKQTNKQTKCQPYGSRGILISAKDIYKCNDEYVISQLPIPMAQWFNALKNTGSSH